MTTAPLLDANVLIALVVADHVHHDAAERWLQQSDAGFATCPITEGSLVRQLLRGRLDAATARSVLRAVHQDPRHEFWGDDLSFLDVRLDGVIGHRQVTDAYLAALARARGSTVITFDAGLRTVHPDVARAIDAD
ncbi:TA system VapC family ribonuclease toxin [Actinomycetospora termitidis]|uniref:Ribonuclease VapC n=1 Tax=Actinomycetospora termitidis TaxID=3053470 RepID=A0ABT7M771_9PSEU|nr:TA system VapC family ribonuclease toxin [Actinomycetospora sp. Odt1-22]MDL5156518.1 PIN domain-containing protein [Actinomycetospora sp. Odt1-22]